MHGSYFTLDYVVTDLLFKGLSVSSVGGLIGLCFGVAAFTFFYESIKFFRRHLVDILHKAISGTESNGTESPRSENSLLARMGGRESDMAKTRLRFHLIQTILYIIQTAMAYTIMLIVMSYNTWLGLSVLMASTLAYFIFGTSTITTPLLVPADPPCMDCE